MKNKISSAMLLIAMLAALVPAAIPAYDAQAQSELIEVEIQPDGANMSDAHIVSTAATTNYGSSTELGVGESNAGSSVYRSLLEFDLTGLPYDMNVITATLTLTVDQDLSDGGTLCAYGVHVDWVEGQVTWNQRKNISVNWQTAGARGANDRELEDAVGCVELSGGLEAGQTVELVLSPNDVEAMRKQNYFGFLLKMEDESNDLYIFRSSDHGTEADRPKLSLSYNPDTPLTDPGWICVDGTYGIHSFVNCPTYALMSPFSSTGSSSGIGGAGKGLTAALLQCEPYPRCVNDYPIYYRLQWSMTWDDPWHSVPESILTQYFTIPGASNITLGVVSCPKKATVNGRSIGDCAGYYEGVILPSQLPVNSSGHHTVGYLATQSLSLATTNLSWDLYLSLTPFDQDCADEWYVPLPETFVIDPLIETPLGIYGEPADDQIYETVIGQTYMVRVLDGPWDDGVDDERTDAAVSLDGETWMTWQDFSMLAFCIDVIPQFMENPDYRILYFEATTEEFHIRVNDIEDQFGDNDNHNETPFSYAIGVAYALTQTSCGSQFSYDETNDWIASVQVISTEEDGAHIESTLQIGEWYAIEVAAGTWNEPPSYTPSKDMEYRFDIFGSTTITNPWDDLTEGAPLVQCQIDDGEAHVVFIQAVDTSLNLRVDDQDDNFANNTGTLGVNIYHATFTRPSSACELNFTLDQLVRSDSVDAKMVNGKVFALVVGSALTNTSGQDENFLSSGLVPGAWYMLETTGGPWGYYGNLHGDTAKKYDLAIASGPVTTSSELTTDWGPLAEWEDAECNIEIDKLGHRRVYFQMPVTGALQYKLRVNDVEGWNTNTGSMSWNLYRAIDLGPPVDGLCDYSFNPSTPLNQTVQTVLADAVNGAYISTGAAIGEPVGAPTLLQANTTYAVELLGEDFKWYEYNGGDPRTDMQLSRNNGTSWSPIPGGGELCAVEDGDNLIFFIRTGVDPKFKLRVNSDTFDNNAGFMGYNIYLAEAGTSVNPYDGCVTEGYSITSLGPFEWIPVYDPMGRGISSTSASYAEIGGLVPGQRYVVETSRGPWFDGETTFDNSSNLAPKYGAQVSADGGQTWYAMDGTNPNVTCWEYTPDLKYYRVEFTVQEGQNWRIRVADTDSERFEDNTGNLAFTLKGLVLPQDTTVTGTFTLAGCNSPPIFPGLLEIDDLLNLGNYLAEWFDYTTGSIIKFFAWCPENTAAVTMFTEDLNTKAPFASLSEINAVLNDIRNEMNAYDWGATGTDYSILNKTPGQSAGMIEEYIFGPLPEDSPWMGGDLVDFSAPMPSEMFYTNCQVSLNDYVGPLLGQGTCFAFNWAKQVGLIFWVQLFFDVGVAWACLKILLEFFYSFAYLLTGVNYSAKTPNVVIHNERSRR